MSWLKSLWGRIRKWFVRPLKEIPVVEPPRVLGTRTREGVIVPDAFIARVFETRTREGVIVPDAFIARVFETRTYERMGIIGPDAFIENKSGRTLILEGTVIKSLLLRPGLTLRVKSPVLEMVLPIAPATLMTIREWDAFEVVDNMLKEYARGIAYDQMDAEDLKGCTYPFPDRALGRILDEVGLKVYREEKTQS